MVSADHNNHGHVRFLATKFHLGRNQFPVSSGIEHFADCTAWDLVHNQFSNSIDTRGRIHPNIASNAIVMDDDGDNGQKGPCR